MQKPVIKSMTIRIIFFSDLIKIGLVLLDHRTNFKNMQQTGRFSGLNQLILFILLISIKSVLSQLSFKMANTNLFNRSL